MFNAILMQLVNSCIQFHVKLDGCSMEHATIGVDGLSFINLVPREEKEREYKLDQS